MRFLPKLDHAIDTALWLADAGVAVRSLCSHNKYYVIGIAIWLAAAGVTVKSLCTISQLEPVRHHADMQRLASLFQASGISVQPNGQQHAAKGARLSGEKSGDTVIALLNCGDEVFKVTGSVGADVKAALEEELKQSCVPKRNNPGAVDTADASFLPLEL